MKKNKEAYRYQKRTLDEETLVGFYTVQEKKRRSSEQRTSSGNIIANACGKNLTAPNYINKKIERELVSFKEEIQEKYEHSSMNKTYSFNRVTPKTVLRIDERINTEPDAEALLSQDPIIVHSSFLSSCDSERLT